MEHRASMSSSVISIKTEFLFKPFQHLSKTSKEAALP